MQLSNISKVIDLNRINVLPSPILLEFYFFDSFRFSMSIKFCAMRIKL